MGVSTVNTKTNTCNGNNNKKFIKDQIGNTEHGMVGGITKWKLEPKGSNNGNTMVLYGKTCHLFTNHYDIVMWVHHKP